MNSKEKSESKKIAKRQKLIFRKISKIQKEKGASYVNFENRGHRKT